MHRASLAAVVILSASSLAQAADAPPLVHEAVLNVPVQKVWEVFATAEGYKHWGVAHAEVDLRVGGLIRSVYNPSATIGDASTIEQTILAYDPLKMIAFRCTRTPEGFPFPDAMRQTWSVATLDDLGNNRTRLTLKGFGYTDAEDSMKMRTFFEAGNAWSLEKLRAALEGTPAPTRDPHAAAKEGGDAMDISPPRLISETGGSGPIEVEAVLPASLASVWNTWTSGPAMSKALDIHADIQLRIGGPFELHFDQAAPEGSRGSEGCAVLAYEPMRMLSFDWNAPPQFAHARGERTWVVVRFEELAPERTRVSLTHHGWQEKLASQPEHSAQWAEVRAYFTKAWPTLMGWMQQGVAKNTP